MAWWLPPTLNVFPQPRARPQARTEAPAAAGEAQVAAAGPQGGCAWGKRGQRCGQHAVPTAATATAGRPLTGSALESQASTHAMRGVVRMSAQFLWQAGAGSERVGAASNAGTPQEPRQRQSCCCRRPAAALLLLPQRACCRLAQAGAGPPLRTRIPRGKGRRRRTLQSPAPGTRRACPAACSCCL